MLDILLKCKGPETCFGSGAAIADLSQSLRMIRFRADGLLPCISTCSRLYSLKLGDFLTLKELYLLMGFPVHQVSRLQAATPRS